MTHGLRLAGIAIVVFTLLGVVGNTANAQMIDHYNEYDFLTHPAVPVPPFTLSDQWGTSKHSTAIYDKFLVPTAQDEDPIGDPELFYTMYFIGFGGEPPRMISVTNKFRDDQMWTVSESFALWNPSLKQMPGGPPPMRNHYKCYFADGPIIDVPVALADQFDSLGVTVIEPAYWCNPTEKRINGEIYDIVDQNAWLGCYFVNPPSVFDPPIPVNITDQFGVIDQELVSRQILCVPSLKAGPVPTQTLSWGQLKATFR